MSAPKRIQRKRTRGWRMPGGAVYVGRPTCWGNPFLVTPTRTAEEAVALFRDWLDGSIARFEASRPAPAWIAGALRGKDLVCWCPLDQPCHADVLLEIANGEQP